MPPGGPELSGPPGGGPPFPPGTPRQPGLGQLTGRSAVPPRRDQHAAPAGAGHRRGDPGLPRGRRAAGPPHPALALRPSAAHPHHQGPRSRRAPAALRPTRTAAPCTCRSAAPSSTSGTSPPPLVGAACRTAAAPPGRFRPARDSAAVRAAESRTGAAAQSVRSRLAPPQQSLAVLRPAGVRGRARRTGRRRAQPGSPADGAGLPAAGADRPGSRGPSSPSPTYRGTARVELDRFPEFTEEEAEMTRTQTVPRPARPRERPPLVLPPPQGAGCPTDREPRTPPGDRGPSGPGA